MYFNQIAVSGLGCFSYVIGCPGAKAMAVVDPKRDVQDYLDISREEGMRITHIFNPTTIHNAPASMQQVSVSDERDTPDGSSSVSMRRDQ